MKMIIKSKLEKRILKESRLKKKELIGLSTDWLEKVKSIGKS